MSRTYAHSYRSVAYKASIERLERFSMLRWYHPTRYPLKPSIRAYKRFREWYYTGWSLTKPSWYANMYDERPRRRRLREQLRKVVVHRIYEQVWDLARKPSEYYW